MFEKDRICAVVAAPTATEMVRQLRCALRFTRSVELRLDWLRSHLEFSRLFPLQRAVSRGVNLIATCRRLGAGGKFRDSVPAQAACLGLAGLWGCRWCDIEVESIAASPRDLLDRVLSKMRRIVSFHEFRGTPKRVQALLGPMRRLGDAVKVATQCDSLRDVLRLFELARGRKNVVVVPMGEVGLPGRILALREGSALAYAAVDQKTAPGQLSLEEMKHLYRADRLTRRTRVYGVIGDPVAQSLSPLLHNAGFRARRMDAVYLPFLVRDLRDFLAAIEPLGIAGFSVTLPHKRRILRYLDGCDPLARAIGAVNTVVVRGGGKLYGYNTDYVGVLRALERRVNLRGSRVLLYGAGGAARAAAFALAQGGAVVCIAARHREKAWNLARAVGGEVIERARLRREFFDAVVNATPVGMHPRPGESPLRAAELNCRIVMDLIYRPMKTRLLGLAERRGIETVSGVEMFLAQGSAQWEIWTGLRAPEAVMRRAVLAALRREARQGHPRNTTGWAERLV